MSALAPVVRVVTCPLCLQEVELRDTAGEVAYLTMHYHAMPALERAVSSAVVSVWSVRCPGSLARCEQRMATAAPRMRRAATPPPFPRRG
jgi:hypothetical protein